MAKLKPFSGRKRCKDGETYIFKYGKATVPGMWYKNTMWRRLEPVTITFKEFVEVNNG